MGFIKKCLLVSLGFGVAGAIGASFATGTAQALVAAMVQVVNPATSPVLNSSVNDPGRIPYLAGLGSFPGAACTGQSQCLVTSLPVPAGHRVVIQQIAGVITFNGLPTNVLVGNFNANQGFTVPVEPYPAVHFDRQTLFYVDSGNTPVYSVAVDGTTFDSDPSLTLIGYELDCTIAPCAPISTH